MEYQATPVKIVTQEHFQAVAQVVNLVQAGGRVRLISLRVKKLHASKANISHKEALNVNHVIQVSIKPVHNYSARSVQKVLHQRQAERVAARIAQRVILWPKLGSRIAIVVVPVNTKTLTAQQTAKHARMDS